MSGTKKIMAILTIALFTLMVFYSSALKGPPSAAAQQREPVKIGVLLTLTTALALYGTKQLNAIKLAVEKVEAAGGIGGRKIELIVEDSANSNTVAVNGLNKILKDKPVAILGPIMGTQIMALLPIVNKEEVAIFTEASTRKITQQGSPWIFRFSNHDGVGKEAWTKFVVENLKKKKIGILHVANEWGYSGRDLTVEALKKNYKMEPVAISSYQQPDKDMTAQLMEMKNKGADMILVQGHPGDEALIAKQIRRLNIEATHMGSGSLSIASLLDITTEEDLKGSYSEVPAPPPPYADTEAMRSWSAEYEKKFGGQPDTYSLLAYDSMMMLAEVIKKYGADRKAIQKGLNEMKYKGLATEYKADKEGNMNHESVIIQFGEKKSAKVIARIKETVKD